MSNRYSQPRFPAEARSRRAAGALRATLTAALLLSVAGLAGCGTKPDGTATGAIPDDYRLRHPIVLTEAEQTMDLPIAAGERRLSTAVRDNISGFASDHAARSGGAIQIMLPRGSANAATAERLSKDIRATLTRAGIPRDRMIMTAYDAGGHGDAAPIRLAFLSIAAKTAPCGEWPEDLVENTMENRNYSNFGCATQSNLAAQIANPMDLVQPRGMTPIDAERRGVVIDDYRNWGQPRL